MPVSKTIVFTIGDMTFEYDEEKNKANIKKHGISFRSAARVFFDYDRIELYDEENSQEEARYDTIGNISTVSGTIIGNVNRDVKHIDDILFVVYTERVHTIDNGKTIETTRLISARMATNFDRGLYYGKFD